MAERNYYVLCDDNCKFPAMTKEQILAAIEQAVSTGEIKDVDTGFVTKIKEMNANGALTFWVGTQAKYNALSKKQANCLYIITDDGAELDDVIDEIYKNIDAIIEATEANGEQIHKARQDIGIPLATNTNIESGDEIDFDRGDFPCYVFRVESDYIGNPAEYIIVNVPTLDHGFAFTTTVAGFTLSVMYDEEDKKLFVSEAKYGDHDDATTMVTDIYGVKSPAIMALNTSIEDCKNKFNRDFYIENTGLGAGGSYVWNIPDLSNYNLIAIKVTAAPDMGLSNTTLLAYSYTVNGTRTYHAEAYDGAYNITAVYNEGAGKLTITNNSSVYDIIIVGLIGVM